MNTQAGAPCSVCSHPAHRTINNEILAGESTIADLSRTYGLSRQSLMRHRDKHIPAQVAEAVKRDQASGKTPEQHEASLMDQVKDLHKKALGLMAAAYNQRDLRTALAGVGAATKLLELQGRLLGQVDSGAVTINVHQSVEFKMITVNIVQALEPYPEAKAAVLKALGSPTVDG